jgi:hypothetical protein
VRNASGSQEQVQQQVQQQVRQQVQEQVQQQVQEQVQQQVQQQVRQHRPSVCPAGGQTSILHEHTLVRICMREFWPQELQPQ